MPAIHSYQRKTCGQKVSAQLQVCTPSVCTNYRHLVFSFSPPPFMPIRSVHANKIRFPPASALTLVQPVPPIFSCHSFHRPGRWPFVIPLPGLTDTSTFRLRRSLVLFHALFFLSLGSYPSTGVKGRRTQGTSEKQKIAAWKNTDQISPGLGILGSSEGERDMLTQHEQQDFERWITSLFDSLPTF